jgi:hypothetical protein
MVDSQGGVLAPISSVMRNRIINGDMRIDQRRSGASYTQTGGNAYTVDRWVNFAAGSVAGKLTYQQNAGSVTPTVGFGNYLGITSTSAYSIASGDLQAIAQPIEGFNTADLMWGTANASTVTISFSVRSSLTGTFGGSLLNGAGNYSYPFTYTISAANTWEQKSITIAGPTAGTWVGATNGIGLYLILSLGTGSTFVGTAGSWTASGFYGATGQVNVSGTNGATFYITGVQLEKGTQATSFEYRQYGQELALCQRYFETLVGDGVNGYCLMSSILTGTNSWQSWNYKVTKRTAPTVALAPGASWVAATPTYINASISTCNFSNGASLFYVGAPTNSAGLTASAEL